MKRKRLPQMLPLAASKLVLCIAAFPPAFITGDKPRLTHECRQTVAHAAIERFAAQTDATASSAQDFARKPEHQQPGNSAVRKAEGFTRIEVNARNDTEREVTVLRVQTGTSPGLLWGRVH